MVELRDEIYELRARARSRGLIDMAQGMVQARYALPGLQAALLLLKHVSQVHNVPLRVLASAVVTAAAPPADGPWFPGRRRLLPPALPFAAGRGARPNERNAVLQAAVDEARHSTGAAAATVHLIDPGRAGLLFLEAHCGHGPAYCDAYAAPATAVVRALATRRLVTAVETVPACAGHPTDATGARMTVSGTVHTVHAAPLIMPSGHCSGVLAVQHTDIEHRLTGDQETALLALARAVAAWRSWYRQTVILDSLEYLHTAAGAQGHRKT